LKPDVSGQFKLTTELGINTFSPMRLAIAIFLCGAILGHRVPYAQLFHSHHHEHAHASEGPEHAHDHSHAAHPFTEDTSDFALPIGVVNDDHSHDHAFDSHPDIELVTRPTIRQGDLLKLLGVCVSSVQQECASTRLPPPYPPPLRPLSTYCHTHLRTVVILA
jgi:hypothetical protein